MQLVKSKGLLGRLTSFPYDLVFYSADILLFVFSVSFSVNFLLRGMILVIVYMIMLHVWTSVVLVTYEPEIHGAEDLAVKHPDGVDHMQPFEDD